MKRSAPRPGLAVIEARALAYRPRIEAKARSAKAMFIDEARVFVAGGDGGDGVTAWRREKYGACGGPAGGDGGKGGDVRFVADEALNTLAPFRTRRHIRAEPGRPGGSSRKTGRGGADVTIRVPVGTLIFEEESGQRLADLSRSGEAFFAARGGDGGQGNQNFKTSTNRAPRRSTPGWPGEKRWLRLELKLMADVGLVGYPSVGKSTLVAAVSAARPKIAAYPFTTLAPSLGVVRWRDQREFVIADIPGLIEGAHEGRGLGIQFLRHVERTQLLVHVVEVVEGADDEAIERDPIADFEALRAELETFNPELLEREQIAVLNKIDLPRARAREPELRAYFEAIGMPFFAISAAARLGLDPLVDHLGRATMREREGRADLEWWERGGDPRLAEAQQE